MGAVVCAAVAVIRTTTKLAVWIEIIGWIMGKLLSPPLFAGQALAHRLLVLVYTLDLEPLEHSRPLAQPARSSNMRNRNASRAFCLSKCLICKGGNSLAN